MLHNIDNECSHIHHLKPRGMEDDLASTELFKLGHPLPCSSGMCSSKLRVLRAASVHYPVLRKLLYSVYMAIKSHAVVSKIDHALSHADYKSLCDLLKIEDYEDLIVNSIEVDVSDPPSMDESDFSREGLKHVERHLQIKYAVIFEKYKKELDDHPEFPCSSCERLLCRSNLTQYSASTEKFSSDVWVELKQYLARKDENFNTKTYYVCTYCRPLLNQNKLPARCVLNGLYVEEVPEELSNLNAIGKQLIQRAKPFQTIIRLKTYTGKVPIYNATKGLKGTMFFLPLPLHNTIAALDSLGMPCEGDSMLPDPELFILLDGQPTKDKVVWQSLVDVNHIKRAVNKLKETNWIYQNINQDSVDDAAKKAVEVVSSTTSSLIEKATETDLAELEAYTIRRLDEKLPVGSDIEHYRMLKIHEPALDNRLKYLDVMCFPTLFPSGTFGEFHPRNVSISFSEYVKSRLLNMDARFRKSPDYVFYYLWQKEMRELSSGIYNVMKSTGRNGMSVKDFLAGVDSSDKQIEANLSTMLQSVRGTKQFWFLKKSDLLCMIREYGPPTLFLTFSCAEYDSPDIAAYLHKVNDVPAGYPIGKLCAEDPISVSRKFSKKFHDFLNTVIIKGEVLGKVLVHFFKKEYASRGAPHYHVLLWIENAPVIGTDPDSLVLKWIQQRITCRIPDKDSNPDLHNLVMKYQLHKCSSYCKKKHKVGGVFITRCRFGFPRPEADEGQIHSVEECLKSRNRIYTIPRSSNEIRVNNYNPLLLLLWRANIDIQYTAENSLALAHYVTSYITKAEKSHLHELWDEVGSSESLYSRLWSFGVRSLRNRECGMYEACDILLGDHLTEKSQTVQWVAADQPHKRKRRLRNHEKLKELCESDPDSVSIFNDNLIDTFYPARPDDLEDVCLYDFVKWYVFSGVDSAGKRKYRKLTKPRLPNHRLYDPSKEDQREDYYYSLLLLFVPFRCESNLIGKHKNAEQAFKGFLSSSDDMKGHHEKLKKLLEAQNKVKEINEHRDPIENECPKEEENNLGGLEIAGEAMNDMHEADCHDKNDFSLKERISMLNSDQLRIFQNISDHLYHQWQHEKGKCLCTDLKPLHKFISGVGGTGKSFLIETIRQQVSDIWKDDCPGDTKCAVGAPTGLASYNIHGVTVHRMFLLPIEHDARTATYWPLSKETQKVMRTNLCSLKLVIIDEVSMLSNLNLTYIHLRLEELFGGSEWFSAKNILFVGDLLQLPPVNGLPVFSKLTSKAVSNKLGCISAVNIWADTVTYDELTINERQKGDPTYSKILDEVRRGFPTEDSLSRLHERVISGDIATKYSELCELGKHPVCLFPTCKACKDHNTSMLNTLDSKLQHFVSVDEIDETSGTRKWNKKATDALLKANKDCNMTAGLEAELVVAVGARVMLRRNLDTKHGLVNGFIGTAIAITSQCITVKFDQISDPYSVERVRSKFMLMKSFFVYRKQFPLILAFAVTIHKCQGLSLDSAIVDLSEKVFSPGMAYVAMSRVRSLDGLYLTEFDPASIMVSTSCLEEINRLRGIYRTDLPLYDIPKTTKHTKKRKFDINECTEEVPSKVPCKPKFPCKRKLDHLSEGVPTKKTKVDLPKLKTKLDPNTDETLDCYYTGAENDHQQTVWPDLRYYPVDEEWQHNACETIGLQFKSLFVHSNGGPDVVLTRPDCRSLKKIKGDGNCLFRALCFIITGSEDQHFALRTKIIEHMLCIPHMFEGYGADGEMNCINLFHHPTQYESVDDYIQRSRIDTDGVWGTNVEMACLAHILQAPVYCFDASQRRHIWAAYFPTNVDRFIPRDIRQKSLYIYFAHDHFTVVTSTRRR